MNGPRKALRIHKILVTCWFRYLTNALDLVFSVIFKQRHLDKDPQILPKAQLEFGDNGHANYRRFKSPKQHLGFP